MNDDKMRQLYNIRKTQLQKSKDSFCHASKNRLKKIINKKFQTAFIFPLSEFEEVFGNDLWGKNLEYNQLTEQQKQNRNKWEKLRKEILDKGNSQYRASCAEIDLYKIEFKGYTFNLMGEDNGTE